MKGATRSELLRLRARLASAVRGHRLLKDKADELLRCVSREQMRVRSLCAEVEGVMPYLSDLFSAICDEVGEAAFRAAAEAPHPPLLAEAGEQKILSVTVPKLTCFETNVPDFSYWFSEFPPQMDQAVVQLTHFVPKLLEYAEAVARLTILRAESSRTRRRVNALESILIPRYEREIRLLSAKLEENERGNLARVLKSFS